MKKTKNHRNFYRFVFLFTGLILALQSVAGCSVVYAADVQFYTDPMATTSDNSSIVTNPSALIMYKLFSELATSTDVFNTIDNFKKMQNSTEMTTTSNDSSYIYLSQNNVRYLSFGSSPADANFEAKDSATSGITTVLDKLNVLPTDTLTEIFEESLKATYSSYVNKGAYRTKNSIPNNHLVGSAICEEYVNTSDILDPPVTLDEFVETEIQNTDDLLLLTVSETYDESSKQTNAFEEYIYSDHPEDWPSTWRYYRGEILNRSLGRIRGPSGEETYYNLPIGGVISLMENAGFYAEYWVREDGVKMYGDYIMVAADLSIRPRGTIVKTSLGLGIICDTGSFIYANPYQLDIAVAWR